MSLLEDLAGKFMGGQQGGNAALITTVLGAINNHPGGLGGLVQSFQQQGLGGVVSSWVGTGANQSITPQQVQSVMGDHVTAIASKLGVSPEDASAKIAQLLPGVIDHLTPNGQVPAGGTNLLEMGESLLKKFSSS
jgi:uncharacterized protein YidB (DUF937 family)